VDTHVLGEMDAVHEITAPRLASASAGTLAPVHPMAAGGPPAPPVIREATTVRVVDTHALFGPLEAKGPHAPNHLASLFTGVQQLHANADKHPTPAADEAQAIRIATYSGEQLVGGYTLIVEGR
jgi:hypothetical protein